MNRAVAGAALAGMLLGTSATVFALPLPRNAQLASRTSSSTSPDAEFELIAVALADLRAGREEEARRRAAAGPVLARRAFEELLADAAVARLQSGVDVDPVQTRLLTLLAEASGHERASALLVKLPDARPGANPFDPSAGGLERALALFAAIGQVADPGSPGGIAEQRRRAEAALDAARGAGSLVLTYTTLGTLGLYALQGGDVAIARRFWSEALAAAERTGHPYARMVFHRSLALAHARESAFDEALREAEAAERIVASGAVATALLAAQGPALYTELVEYSLQLGDRRRALAFASRAVDLLEAVSAPADARAGALERLAQLHARGAQGSPEDARAGAAAFARAAELHAKDGVTDRAAIAFAGAGVLLVENVSGAEARPFFERARALAEQRKDRATLAGLAYWLGRTHVADAETGSDPKAARAKALALFAEAGARATALERAGAARADLAQLRTLIAYWSGRAHMAGRAPSGAAAATRFREAFDAAIAASTVNDAVTYAEWELRARATEGDPAATSRSAIHLFDALSAPKRLDPLRAAETLARALAEKASGALPPAAVALYQRAGAALAARKTGAGPERAEAALVRLAASVRDTKLLAARATPAFERLMGSMMEPEAAALADAVALAWLEAGDAAEAARWRARLAPLAETAFDAARRGDRFEEAAREADRLARLARAGGDAASERGWVAAAASARGAIAEASEREGRPGAAAQAAREAASGFEAAGDAESAARWYIRAADLAAKINDPAGRALALAGRSRAERMRGDATAAIAAAEEAVRLAAGGIERDWRAEQFPDPAIAIRALVALGEALEPPRALDALALAARLAESTREVTTVSGEEPLVGPFDPRAHQALVRALARSGAVQEALAVAARGLAQLRADTLAATDAPPAARSKLERVLAARRALFVADSEARRDKTVEATRRLETARADLERALADLRAASPELARRAAAEPVRLERFESPFLPK